ncbi:MAG: ferrous iron transport protein B [Candidatus Marinimicrobia bacterium]|nr:ferrous iron transport protein B [Candidatus Neomarinimicrobiota bacterium]
MSNSQPYVALMGNPNSGKTAIFNLLTGLNQKVSNYPGITVEQRLGTADLSEGKTTQILDLPGTYSLTPESLDEKIVASQVVEWMQGKNKPAAIISVVDAANLSRNLYLTTQLLDLNIPVILALNMMDRVKKRKQEIDLENLKSMLGVTAVIPMSAKQHWGIEALQESLREVSAKNSHSSKTPLQLYIPEKIENILEPISKFFEEYIAYPPNLAKTQALRIITRKSALEVYEPHLSPSRIEQLIALRDEAVEHIDASAVNHRILEARLRYELIDRELQSYHLEKVENPHIESRSEKVDKILTHRIWGPLIFIGLLYGIFQSIFTWASLPMDWIDLGIGLVGDAVITAMPPGIFRDLIVEGVVAGVGSILIFLPQILILMFFMTLLEDSGYMARVAFMMDAVMSKVGLHGKSVLPLMSGYACAIPGIMATRTIDNWKERLITILILPLMSCSARLPVYTLMIGAFIPQKTIGGIFNLQGIIMVCMYFLGTITALIIAAVISRFIENRGKSSFVMELPPYRMPLATSLFRQLFIRGKLFVVNAGKIIMAISIVLWFLASFPKMEDQSSLHIQDSYAGKIGQFIEPAIAPLGFDWKIGIGLITSFAAREVVVSTLATLYNVENEGDDVLGITQALKRDIDPVSGKPRYTPLVALSIMVFYVYAAQCMATFAIVRNETNSWKWPLFMMIYMTALAYFGSLLVYQGGQIMGLS